MTDKRNLPVAYVPSVVSTQSGSPDGNGKDGEIPVLEERSVSSFAASEQMREAVLNHRRAVLLASAEEGDSSDISVLRRQSAGAYERLRPLPPAVVQGDRPFSRKEARLFGYSSEVYSAVVKNSGSVVVLRRVDCFHIAASLPRSVSVAAWKAVDHPNIVRLLDVFAAPGFGGGEGAPVFFVSPFHPCSVSLEELFIDPGEEIAGEEFVWSVATQLAAAIRTAHSLRLRLLVEPARVILTGRGVVRVADPQLLDVLHVHAVHSSPQQDIMALGALLLSLVTRKLNSSLSNQTVQQYSPALISFITYLRIPLQNGGPVSMDDVSQSLASATTSFAESVVRHMDALESALLREVENGRLLRLMAKLEFIGETLGVEKDRRWNETGDRYLLKLFRNYLFHERDAEGRAIVDFAHVVDTLNKLDEGVDERVMLTANDQETVLVVSFRDLKRCVESAFAELLQPVPPLPSATT